MGLYAAIVNHDEMLANATGKIVFANDFNTSNAEQKEEFTRHLYSHYQDADAIENSASCECEHITDAHKLGVICEVCGTPVVSTSNRPIVPSMWVRAPEGVVSLVSPELWIMLSGYMTMKEFDFLEYLTNTGYSYDYDTISSKETKKKLDKLLQRGFTRGLNHFIENFDEIFQFLLDANIINNNKGEMYAFVQQNKHKLFPKNLPIPSKLCFVVESTTSGTYIDKPIAAAIDAVLTISSIGSSPIELKSIVVQNRVARFLKLNATFHENYDKQRIAQKQGLIRRHVLGGRLNLTARAVITSISSPHDYDELHIPWGVGCQLLKYHLVNKLKRKFRMTTRDAMSYIYSKVLAYDPMLDSLFKEIIAESKYKGLAAVFHRNPTLQRGSTQQFFITKVKSDIRDNSISMSVLCLKAPNADFDGDQLNLTLMPDNYLADATDRIAPWSWVLSTDDPHEISGNLELQGPVVETIINFAHEDYLPPLEEWLKMAA
ncbi:RNA polymerase beta subunit [Pseudomonas phage PhiPA3]|uniref:DNA-directed RNA polymerase n=1 Tax=Pseudomonas phage PhiPA3 TaxID=998086 RepID=F8SJT6_BPPA3|nr:RNA polymerase beta subunit [Pseudomonas phage PhiPA3]AEH03481.1 hypothetical protein [Pseudomonas phage PhiPA3]